MGDSYTNEYFFDSGMIKQEPFSMEGIQISTTASVPIPTRRGMNSDMQDLGFEIDCLDSPPIDEGSVGSENTLLTDYQTVGSNLMWGTRLTTIDAESSQLDTFKMDDDDIFQVDKADLIQGPTLAELNANDDTLLADLNFDDLLLPEENKFSISLPANSVKFSMPSVHIINSNLSYLSNNNNNNTSSLITFTPSSCPQTGLGFYRDLIEPSSSVPSSPFDPFSPKSNAAFSPASQHSSSSSLLATSSPPLQPTVVKAGSTQRHSTLHELLLKRDTHPPLNRTVPSTSTGGPSSPNGCKTLKTHSSRLSSSAPTRLGLEQIWQRREPRPHLVSTGSLAEAGSTSSLSTGGVLSPDPQDLSHDEGFDSDEDSEHYEDFSSDGDSDDENPRRLSTSSASKKERYFWQYNVQAKGPKGQRLVLKTKLEDPHILNEITDPVFSPSCSVRGIKHSGKARKGDGNDLTPNPRKLHSIGRELDKLGRIINDMTPVSELPFNVRPKTRKEKNKLASRACRLKKKAQHEANKLKLFGLEHEHKRLLTGISQTKQLLKMKLETSSENQDEISKQMDRVAKTATKVKIAGHSTEFVNKVLEKVKSGIPNGGLEEF